MGDQSCPSARPWPSRSMPDRVSRPSRLAGLQRSLPTSSSGTAQICVKGTFLQVVEPPLQDEGPLSPTSLSDPGSEVSGSGIYQPVEQQQMEILNKRMADLWSRGSKSDVASESSAYGGDEPPPSGNEFSQQHQPRRMAELHSGARGSGLPDHSSATDSPASRSSLSTWQGISQDVHEALLRHQMGEMVAESAHPSSAGTLHQAELLQNQLGCHSVFGQQSEEQQQQQVLMQESFGWIPHPSHPGLQPWVPHIPRCSFPPQLAATMVPNDIPLASSPHFANMVEGAQASCMGAAAAAYRPHNFHNAVHPANQCDDFMWELSKIPEQVRLLLESTAQGVAQDVYGEVLAKGNVIRVNSSSRGEAEVAVEKLECIPNMILNSFEGKLMRVKDRVRRKVHNVIQELDNSAHHKDDLVKKLYTIPEEVVNITSEVMEEVLQDSQMKTAQQIDDAVLSCPQVCVENTAALHGMQSNISSIVASVPDLYSSTSQAVHNKATEAVEQAVAKVCDKIACPANEIVAEQLLRIKAAGSQGSSSTAPGIMHMTSPAGLPGGQVNEGAMRRRAESSLPSQDSATDVGVISSAQPGNPGSVGHPELCPRPCLYFVRGQCANGNNCDFCHLPHPKRPSHLDKRHREMLKRMPFAESVSVAMPVLREKARSLSLRNDVMELLDRLEEAANRSVLNSHHGAASSSRPPKRHGRSRNLQGAMRGITLRSLLTALHRSDLPEDSPERTALADLLRSLRSVAPEFPHDLASEQVAEED